MKKYLLNSQQVKELIEKAIDLFLEYQYKRGYDEPKARSEAVMEVMGSIKSFSADPPVYGSE
jgi:septation ring formation regulator EzrA